MPLGTHMRSAYHVPSLPCVVPHGSSSSRATLSRQATLELPCSVSQGFAPRLADARLENPLFFGSWGFAEERASVHLQPSPRKGTKKAVRALSKPLSRRANSHWALQALYTRQPAALDQQKRTIRVGRDESYRPEETGATLFANASQPGAGMRAGGRRGSRTREEPEDEPRPYVET